MKDLIAKISSDYELKRAGIQILDKNQKQVVEAFINTYGAKAQAKDWAPVTKAAADRDFAGYCVGDYFMDFMINGELYEINIDQNSFLSWV